MAALAGAPGCRIENDAHQPQPPAAALASTVALGAASDEVPRGPRHDLLSMSRSEIWAAWNSVRGDAYPLDPIERRVDAGVRMECSARGLVNHRGQLVPYQGAVRVDPAFRERLLRFEQVLLDVATDVYGRAPSRVRHFGAYVCRSTRNRAYRMSEHALGNAIDIAGFDFARAKKHQPLAAGLPRALSGPFQIRVAKHWTPSDASAVAAVHARFLRELADRLSDRSDVFRGMIGPSRSDHSDHFHFDMSPWRYVYF
ncbi:MAG TPA: extensin family protein [Polyangiaceae bacterium]|nr:extensin family protein [Polyangiaceae bacterium]